MTVVTTANETWYPLPATEAELAEALVDKEKLDSEILSNLAWLDHRKRKVFRTETGTGVSGTLISKASDPHGEFLVDATVAVDAGSGSYITIELRLKSLNQSTFVEAVEETIIVQQYVNTTSDNAVEIRFFQVFATPDVADMVYAVEIEVTAGTLVYAEMTTEFIREI